jgi:hypothetical protein
MPPDDRDEFGIEAALRRYEEELVLERMCDPADLVQLEFLEGMIETHRHLREIARQYLALTPRDREEVAGQYRALLREGQA